VYNFSEAYRSLDSKMHMATSKISSMLQHLATKAISPPTQAAAPQLAPTCLTAEEVEKLSALTTKMGSLGAASASTFESMGMQVVQEAQEQVAACMERLVASDA